jgi:hypothetical protein
VFSFRGSPYVLKPRSLLPMSAGIAYAVRRLLEYGAISEGEAHRLCARLWPKMDVGAIETVLDYWRDHRMSESSEMAAGPPAKVSRIA